MGLFMVLWMTHFAHIYSTEKDLFAVYRLTTIMTKKEGNRRQIYCN